MQELVGAPKDQLSCILAHLIEKPPWRSGYVIRLVIQGSQVRSRASWSSPSDWDYKPRPRLHMTLAVGRSLNTKLINHLIDIIFGSMISVTNKQKLTIYSSFVYNLFLIN